jgi:histidinol-phosphatase (PHP family)
MLVDCHTHLQPHGQRPPIDRARIDLYVEAGRARGITTVAVTEHLFRFREAYDLLVGWWDDDPDHALAALAKQYWDDHVSLSVADYVRTVEEAKSAGASVLLGLEMDWIHGKEEQLRSFLAPYDWDIVLGSVHYIGAWGFDDPRFIDEWSKRDVDGAWDDYARLVGELAQTRLADVLAHPDLPKVFGHRPRDETPLHDAILAAASEHGIAVELNSNGIRRCKEIYPAMPLLERAHVAGVPITLGSDAHTPDRVGANFDDLLAWARRAGYAEASAFINRKPTAYKIADER